MIYLLDTSVWIEFFSTSRAERTIRIKQRVREYNDTGELAFCGPVLTELIQGVPQIEEADLAAGLNPFLFLEPNRKTFELAGRLSRELTSKGLPVPTLDYLIAATAMAYDSTLVTADRHFERFPDLKLLLLE